MPVSFSKLRITGFKSFAEPTSVDILPGLTGIVGPNGCGKSNIVEALRWAMGESSARLLAAAGCDVAIVDVEADRAERVAGVVRGLGRKSAAIVANVLEDSGAERAVGEAERVLGGLDVLVAIVGQALFTPIVDMSPGVALSIRRANLVAITYSSRWPSIARPTRSSFVSGP